LRPLFAVGLPSCPYVFDVIHPVEYVGCHRRAHGQYNPAVLFEMSVTDANKPPLDPMEVEC
jgi:hypothetical protein